MWQGAVGAPSFLALTQLRQEVGKGKVGQSGSKIGIGRKTTSHLRRMIDSQSLL